MPLTAFDPVQLPERRYTRQALITSGAAARVYRGTDHRTGKTIALKQLRHELPHHTVERERLIREGRLLGLINHPNLVDITDLVIDGDDVTLVLGLVDGVDLRRLMVAFAPLMPLVVVPAVVQAARALGHLHRRGVIHRDVKPANLLINSQGHVRVCDLGAAHVLASPRDGDAGRVVGSPAFVAPECITGEAPTPAADLYALGVVLYQGLTGRLPFSGLDHHAVFAARLESEPADVRDHNPLISAELAQMVEQLIHRDPAARPRDALALAEQLEQCSAARPGRRAMETLREAIALLRDQPIPTTASCMQPTAPESPLVSEASHQAG
ncbi:MAG: serine/threonine-protein kinase [Bradymonadia bacterium]